MYRNSIVTLGASLSPDATYLLSCICVRGNKSERHPTVPVTLSEKQLRAGQSGFLQLTVRKFTTPKQVSVVCQLLLQNVVVQNQLYVDNSFAILATTHCVEIRSTHTLQLKHSIPIESAKRDLLHYSNGLLAVVICKTISYRIQVWNVKSNHWVGSIVLPEFRQNEDFDKDCSSEIIR